MFTNYEPETLVVYKFKAGGCQMEMRYLEARQRNQKKQSRKHCGKLAICHSTQVIGLKLNFACGEISGR